MNSMTACYYYYHLLHHWECNPEPDDDANDFFFYVCRYCKAYTPDRGPFWLVSSTDLQKCSVGRHEVAPNEVTILCGDVYEAYQNRWHTHNVYRAMFLDNDVAPLELMDLSLIVFYYILKQPSDDYDIYAAEYKLERVAR